MNRRAKLAGGLVAALLIIGSAWYVATHYSSAAAKPPIDLARYRPPAGLSALQADRVVIVVIDGARYSETLGDTTRQNYLHIIRDLAPQGVTYTDFRNEGVT
ncbi:MAG TPA: hypothetical protein PKM88_06605, partial [bacterium]|nr:hypothetical protein [bacterium]